MLRSFHASSISTQLAVSCGLLTILSLAFMLSMTTVATREALTHAYTERLDGIALNRARALDAYAQERVHDLRQLALMPQWPSLLEVLGSAARSNPNVSSRATKRSAAALTLHELRAAFALLNANEFENTFLLSITGEVLLSIKQPQLLGVNVAEAPLSGTGLQAAFLAARALSPIEFSNFGPFESKTGHAAFIAAPLLRAGQIVGVLALQIAPDALQRIATDRAGLGETGEIVVARDSAGHPLVTAPLRHDADAAFRGRLASVDDSLLPIARAVRGTQGRGLTIDYRGVEIVAAWRYVPALRWGIVAKVDRAEAFAPSLALRKQIISWTFLAGLLVVALALQFGRRLTRPLVALTRQTESIAAGEFERRLEVEGSLEIRQLGRAFNRMASALAVSRTALHDQMAALDEHAIVSITDVRGAITYANPKFIEISGYSGAELLGRNHRIVNSGEHPPEFFRELWRTIARGRVWKGEIKNRAKNGHCYWVAATIVPFLDPHGEPDHYVAIRTDIDDRKRAELKARDSEQAALRALRAKSEFLANMSHEIRTPMNGVLGVSDLLLDTELDPEQREFVRMIHSSGDALLSIINDILDLSKIESGKLLLEERPIDLESVVRDTMQLLRAKADDGGIDFRLHYAADAPRAVIADGGRIRQILLNLISNAIKFTKQGHVEVRVECESRTQGEARLRFSVEDTGIGVAQDALERIFDKFVQADTSTTRHFGGTGLGLAIIKQLVDAMRGGVAVRSQLGVGSTFVVTLPVSLAAQRETELPVAQESVREASPIAARVLLAEDNAVNQKVACRMLEKLGCTVDCANNGNECVSMLERESYDLIFMDIQMPEMGGVDATRIVRAKQVVARSGRPIPIVALTANAMPGDREACIEAGMDDYLTKPIAQPEFRGALERWFALANPQDRDS